MIKSILKLIFALLVGMAIGLVVASAGIALFTDMTVSELFGKIASEGAGLWKPVIVGILAVIASFFILVTVHEAGHLVAGLLTGYKFVSFRVGNLTFIKIDGKLKVKKFAVAGTGGQCLLSPPDVPLDKMPVTWYNLGGLLANVLIGLLVIPLLFVNPHPLVAESAAIFLLLDLFLLILNGIPMKANGMGNDAYNALKLRKNLKALRGVVVQLKANAAIQNGLRPKDMPDQWFEVEDDVDYSNPLELAPELMLASRYLDMKDYDNSKNTFENLYSHKNEIVRIYVNEIECELIYLYLLAGEIDRAKELYDKRLEAYIKAYQKVSSAKKRLLCAVALKIDDDHKKAQAIYDDLYTHRDEYLLQGEVSSDLDLMQDLLK